MIQGCGSDVGKSVLVAGLCRLFANRGLSVRPFKSQNMSNNAAVAAGGGEIGRAQALQAQACRVAPTVDMNPVLLKPQGDRTAQLIVLGRMNGNLDAADHGRDKRALLDVAIASFRRLQQQADLVIVEGAGSPAETNLREHDIANMGLARALGLPVILVGDIHRGHVIASLVGAHAVLDPPDRATVRGFIINKFRGDVRLFDAGLQRIVHHTGWAPLGVVPWLEAAGRLPPEDGMQLEARPMPPGPGARIRIAVPRLARIANFDDFDPLRAEPGIDLVFVRAGEPLPADAALVILPGSKSTLADLQFFREQGWDIDLRAHVRRGGRVLGICGGYQMMGRTLSDPDGIEGPPGSVAGLGLLALDTVMTGAKTLREVAGSLVLDTGRASSQVRFSGYEMHVGATTGQGTGRPLLQLDDGTADGAVSDDGLAAGCYVHGLFQSPAMRAALLGPLGVRAGGTDHRQRVDSALDEIAAVLQDTLDIGSLQAIAGI